MSRLLIVNADDFGLTPGVCEAILTANEVGIVTSTSALVVGPAWDRYAATLAASGMGVGAHLCLVGEDPPLLGATEVPTLVDDRGRLPTSWRVFLARAAVGRVDADDIRRELTAQMEAVVGSGVRVTHIDAHQNLHQWPLVSTVVFELAAAFGVRSARCTRSTGWAPTKLGVRVLAARFERSCARRGLVVPDASSGLDDAGRLTLDRLTAVVAGLAASGARTAEIAAHPGTAVDPDRDRLAYYRRLWNET